MIPCHSAISPPVTRAAPRLLCVAPNGKVALWSAYSVVAASSVHSLTFKSGDAPVTTRSISAWLVLRKCSVRSCRLDVQYQRVAATSLGSMPSSASSR